MDWFDRILSVAAGFAGLIMFAHLIEVDWQLALVAIRDATAGRWMPEFNMEVDISKLKMALGR